MPPFPLTRDDDGWTPITMACVHGHLEAVEKLLDARADVDAVTYYGSTPLMLAGKGKHVYFSVVVKGICPDRSDNVEAMLYQSFILALISVPNSLSTPHSSPSLQRGHCASADKSWGRSADCGP